MEVKEQVIHSIQSKKGFDIRVYDCGVVNPFVETMIVASTTNLRQNHAVANTIKEDVRKLGYDREIIISGNAQSKWLLIDLRDVVVHLFVAQERQVYGLDRLYADVPVTSYDV